MIDLNKSVNALAVKEQELRQELSADQEARFQLESRLVKLQSQPAETAPESHVVPETVKAGGTEVKNPASGENIRRYAKAILRAYSAHDNGTEDDLEKDQLLQATFMEMLAEMTRLMAKHNLVMDTRRSMGDEIFNAYGVPEIRQWYGRLGAAMLEDLGLPLTEAQITAVDRAMLAASERYKSIDNPEFTRMEKSIVLSRFQAEQSAEFARIFTDEQNQKLPKEVADALVGRSEHSSGLYPRIDANNKTISDCAGAVLQQWSREMRLDDTEKQGVKYLAEMYVSEQAALKYSCESEYSKEFMDFYLERYDRSVRDNTNTWWSARNKFFENPANRAKQEALNLRFAELQVKYQRQLINALPAKAERIKNQYPTVTIFSYLGS
jgi:hypothetical protein